jgi:hypothetical protein
MTIWYCALAIQGGYHGPKWGGTPLQSYVKFETRWIRLRLLWYQRTAWWIIDSRGTKRALYELISRSLRLSRQARRKRYCVSENSEKIYSVRMHRCFDVVTPNHRRSACFTQSYGRYIKGTVILYEIRTPRAATDCTFWEQFDKDWANDLDFKLRYFSRARRLLLLDW